MTSAAMLAKMKLRMGNILFGLSDANLYEYLTGAKEDLEEDTNLSMKQNVPIITGANAQSLDLTSSAVINVDSGATVIDVQKVWYDWDGFNYLGYYSHFYANYQDARDPNALTKKPVSTIDQLRQINDFYDRPVIWGTKRSGGGFTLELYPGIKTAQAAFATSKLKCNISQKTTDIDADTDPVTPAYANNAIIYKAIVDIFMAFNHQPFANFKRRADKETRKVKNISNKENTGRIIVKTAQ